jgi:hypothetical protein
MIIFTSSPCTCHDVTSVAQWFWPVVADGAAKNQYGRSWRQRGILSKSIDLYSLRERMCLLMTTLQQQKKIYNIPPIKKGRVGGKPVQLPFFRNKMKFSTHSSSYLCTDFI